MPKHPQRTPDTPGRGEADAHQTSVWLTPEEVGWIDAQILRMKQSGWRGVTRSAFIRALIRGAMHATPSLAGVRSETADRDALMPVVR
jgi:hypothetical protein